MSPSNSIAIADPLVSSNNPHAISTSQRQWQLFVLAVWLPILFMHFGFLKLHSLWNNEFITLESIKLPLGAMIRERVERNHAPGYFVMLKAWTAVLGKSEIVLHFPSAVFSLLGVFCIWRTARLMFGERWAVAALALAGFNEAHIQLSTDARMYSWLVCASAATLWAFVAWQRGATGGARRKPLYGIALAGLFGIMSHLLYLLVTAAMAINVALRWRAIGRERGVRARRGLVASILAPVLLMLPLILWWEKVQDKVGGARKKTPLDVISTFRKVAALMFGERLHSTPSFWQRYASWALAAAILLVVIPLLIGLIRKILRKSRAQIENSSSLTVPGNDQLALWLWLLVPAIGVMVAETHSKQKMTTELRYFVTGAPAATLLLVVALRHCVGLVGRAATIVPALAVIALVAHNTIAWVKWPGTGMREAIAIIARERRPDDLIVTSQNKNRTFAFIYYGLVPDLPPEKPDPVQKSKKVLEWLRPQLAGKRRLWVAFYKPGGKDYVQKMIDKNKDAFTPLRPYEQWSDVGLGLFDVPEEMRK